MARQIKIEILGDARGLRSAFREAERSTSGFAKGIARAGVFAATGIAGITAGVGVALAKTITAAQESNKVSKQTAAVLKSTGGVAKVTAKQVSDLATAISNKTGIDDEAIQSSENLLLTFTNIRNVVGKNNDIFTQATKITQDMAVALGQDGTQSAIQLGKALQDPIRGVTALRRVGVDFTAQQQDQIKTLVKSGKTLEAQKIILRELGREFGGSAEAAATPLDKLRVIVGNLQEKIGNQLLPVVNTLADWISKRVVPAVSTFLDKLQNDIIPAVIAFATDHGPKFKAILDGVKKAFDTIAAALTDPKKGVVPNLEKLRQSWDDNKVAIEGFQNAIPGANTLLHAMGTAVHRALEEVTGLGKLLLGLGALASVGAQAVRVAFDAIGIAALEVQGFFQTLVINFFDSLRTLASVVDRLLGTHLAGTLDGALRRMRAARADTQAQVDKLKADATKRFQELQREIDKLHGKNIPITASLRLEFSKSFTQKDWVQVRLAAGRMAAGGLVSGPGGPTADRVPALLSNGEFVVNAATVRGLGVDTMKRLNAMRFAAGGPVGQIDSESRAVNKVEAWGTGHRMDRGINKIMGTFGGAGGSADVNSVARWTAMILGRPAEWAAWARRIMFESGGRWDAVNRTDSNWFAGHPSVGGAQVIRGTFQRWADGFRGVGPFLYGVSINPRANSFAGANYAIHRYGSLAAVDPRIRPIGYDAGGWLPPGLSLSWNGTGRAEPVGVAAGPTVVNIYPAPGMSERRVGQMVVAALEERDRRAAKGKRA